MFFEIRELFLLFIIYSIIGWILEVFYNLIFEDKKIVNRGFLIGPYCPIYGVGCLLILGLLFRYKSQPVGLFVLSMVICSLLEYITSYVMEKLFKARWWDYSDKRFNINGRICLETMIPFGIVSCLIIYIVNPFFVSILREVPGIDLTILFIVTSIIFIVDVITSFNVVNNFKRTVKKVSLEDKTEDINKYVKDILMKKSFLYRRLVIAFPRIETKLKVIRNELDKITKKD